MIVETESGTTYTVDHEAGTVLRHPSEGEMRRDDEPIEFVTMAEPVVGQVWRMVLRLRGDGVYTYRTTSPVTKVVR